MTGGVIQPAQVLSRGKDFLSRISTSRSAARSFQAQLDPAGPPPTMSTSQVTIANAFGPALTLGRIDLSARPRNGVVSGVGEGHLKELKHPRREAGQGTGEVQPPGADEAAIEHAFDRGSRAVEAAEPVFERLGIVQANVLHVEHGKTLWLQYPKHLAERRDVGARENALFQPGIHRVREIAADEMEQAASVRTETSLNEGAELGI